MSGSAVQLEEHRAALTGHAFTVRVVVSTAPGASGPAMTGEARRQLFLHRDQSMLSGFPLEMRGDGDASPVLADLVGSDTNQLIVANSDGWIHAYRYNTSTGAVSGVAIRSNTRARPEWRPSLKSSMTSAAAAGFARTTTPRWRTWTVPRRRSHMY